MLNFMKRKKITSSIVALALIGIFATVVYAAYNERQVTVFWNKVTFKNILDVQDELKFSSDAVITSTKELNPRNYIDNSELAIWSGGTRWGSGGLASVPDGWYIPNLSTYTGVTRTDVSTIAPVSSVTPQAIHSMYINTWDATTGAGNTNYIAYPDSGVSTAAWWYNKFAGHSVVFGAWVKRDIDQFIASGVSTNFIRPFINTNTTYVAAETYFTFGDYIENDGWTLSTMEYNVPAGATAFEVGFAMNPTVLAPPGGSSTGDSAYIVAPFLLINPLNKEYVSRPDEIIWFKKQLDVWTGGSTFGAKATARAAVSLDLSADVGWNGIVPDDTKAIYASVGGTFSGVLAADFLHFYGDESLSGVTIRTPVAGIASLERPVWIPVSSTGTINVDNINVVTGVSLWVHGAQIN